MGSRASVESAKLDNWLMAMQCVICILDRYGKKKISDIKIKVSIKGCDKTKYTFCCFFLRKITFPLFLYPGNPKYIYWP